MSDTLEVFGVEYTGVNGFKAKDENGNTLIYTRNGSGVTIIDTVDSHGGTIRTITAVESPSFIGSGTKTYIIQNGRIVSGYTFSCMTNTTLTEETLNDIPYVYGHTTGNNYGAFWTSSFDMSNYAYGLLVLELENINNNYGFVWSGGGIGVGSGTATNNNTVPTSSKVIFTENGDSDYFDNSTFVISVPSFTSNGYIKIDITGNSSHDGFINIKNLYFLT